MKFTQKTVYRAIMILAVCVFILANLCAGRLVRFAGLTLDFTGERLFSLSDTTKAAVSALQSETWIAVTSAEEACPPVLREFLRRYSALSPFIVTRYVDPYADPVFLDYCARQGFTPGESDILVGGDRGMRQIRAEDIFVNDGGGKAAGLYLEEKLTNAILYANSGRDFSASFTVGHGESHAPSLEALFSDSGFSVKNLALSAGETPAGDVLVIANPERDFPPEETAALDGYLARGGKVLLFMGPRSAGLPELESFLSAWGLSLLPGVVMEAFAHTPGNPASLIPLYGMHEINLDFAKRQYYLAMPGARAIETAGETGDVIITRLLLSTRDAYEKTGVTNASAAPNAGDTAGPFVLAAAAEKPGGRGALMLFGSGGLYDPGLLAAPAYANREYLARAAHWLAGGDTQDLVSIPPKTLSPPSVNAGFGLTLAVLLVFAVALPLSALLAGAVTLYRRQRR